MKKMILSCFLIGSVVSVFAMDPEAEENRGEASGQQAVQQQNQEAPVPHLQPLADFPQIVPGAAYVHAFEIIEVQENFKIKVPDEQKPKLVAFFNAQGQQIASLIKTQRDLVGRNLTSMCDPHAGSPEVDSYSIETPKIVVEGSGVGNWLAEKTLNYTLKNASRLGLKQIVFYKNSLPVKAFDYKSENERIDESGGAFNHNEGKLMTELTTVIVSPNIQQRESFYNHDVIMND